MGSQSITLFKEPALAGALPRRQKQVSISNSFVSKAFTHRCISEGDTQAAMQKKMDALKNELEKYKRAARLGQKNGNRAADEPLGSGPEEEEEHTSYVSRVSVVLFSQLKRIIYLISSPPKVLWERNRKQQDSPASATQGHLRRSQSEEAMPVSCARVSRVQNHRSQAAIH